MKSKLLRLVMAVVLTGFASSCTTVYDPYGRPQQVVDPAAAVVGAAAVGLLAYGLASSYDDCNRGYSHHGGHHHGYYGRSYGRYHHRGYCAY